MKRKRYAQEQVAFALRRTETGASVAEICRRLGIAVQTFYRWKKQFAGIGGTKLRRLRELKVENVKLKQLVAESEPGGALSPQCRGLQTALADPRTRAEAIESLRG